MQVTWGNLEHPINRDRRSIAIDDVVAHGASDRALNLNRRSSLKCRGYVALSDWTTIHISKYLNLSR